MSLRHMRNLMRQHARKQGIIIDEVHQSRIHKDLFGWEREGVDFRL
jgi:ABC-type transport system involved in cytochrome c biogenesis ATPase subunit